MMVDYKRRQGIVLSSPLWMFILLTLLIPILVNIIYSFSKVEFRTLTSPQIIGFSNYIELFRDENFFAALRFSLFFAVACIILEMGLALAFVAVFDSITRQRPYLNVFIILPMMIPPALSGLMYSLSFNEFIGVIPHVLKIFGIEYSFLTNKHIISTVILIEILQWTPFAYLMLLSAWQTLSEEVIEASFVDGASRWKRFVLIRMPMLKSVFIATAFIRFIDSFRAFDTIFVLTKGGPGTRTTTLSIYIYKNFFTFENIGRATSASMLLFGAGIFIFYVFTRRISEEEK